MFLIKKFCSANILFIIILTCTVFILYGKSINFELTNLDDNTLVTENINLISDINNIPKLFLTSCFYSNDYLYYRPVLSLSFAIEAILFRDNLKIYHITNLILFVLSFYFIYLFLIQFKFNKNILKILLLITAVHPIFTSTAVWIPARNDSLITVLLMISLINLIKYIDFNKIKYLLLYIIFFILSLFAKETAVILIPLCFFVIYAFNYKITKQQIINIFLMLIPVLASYFILRSVAVSGFALTEYISNFHIYLTNALKSLMIYLYNFIFPEHIPVILFNADINAEIIFVNATFLCVLSFLCYKKIINIKTAVFCLIWIFLTLFPTFLQVDNVLFPHRFLFPSVALIIILAELFQRIVIKFPVSQTYLIFFAASVFIMFSYASYMQADKYKNSEQHWINAYYDAPEYHAVCNAMVNMYLKYGNIKEAEILMKKTLKLKFSYRYLLSYANLLFAEGNFDKSEETYLKILKDIPGRKELVYHPLSEIYFIRKDYQKALEYSKLSYDLFPHNINYSKQLAKIYESLRKYAMAVKVYENLLIFDKENNEYINKIKYLYDKIEKEGHLNV